MKKFSILLCSRGVSYIQILLASSVVAGLAVVGLKMMQNQERLARLTSDKFEISYIVNEMSYLLSDPLSCRASFAGLNPVKSVRKINSLKKELKGGKHKEASFYLKYFTFDSSKKLYGQNSVKILSYKLTDKAKGVDVEKGTTNLVVEFQSEGEEPNSRIISKSIPLRIKTREERLLACEVFGGSSSDGGSGGADIYIGKGLHLGKKKDSLTLSVDGALTIVPTSGDFPICSTSNIGKLIFLKKLDGLFLCSENGTWSSLQKIPDSFKNVSNYKVESLDSPLAELMTRRHRVCILKEVKSNEKGTCTLTPLALKGNTNWKISAQFSTSRGGQYCKAECFN